jgi:uncharacterized protein
VSYFFTFVSTMSSAHDLVRDRCRSFVAKHSAGYDASHDISHIDRVVKNAENILELSNEETRQTVKQEVLIAIASLHDTFDHKYLLTDEAVGKAKAEVREFLHGELNFTNETIDMIIHVIDNMGYTAEVSGSASTALDKQHLAYLHVIQDADRLDAIGAIGIARCLTFTGAFGRPIVSPDAAGEREQRAQFQRGMLKPVAGKKGSAIAHFYDKLVFLRDMLKTPAGKELGEQRHEFLLKFLDQFFSEIGE